MKISLSWLATYLDVAPIRADLKGVLGRLTMRGLEVESIHDLSQGFDKVVIAQIETRDRHPNADRLSICKVNTGKETLQIVCGAQNMKAGDKVALSQIGAHLPNGLKIEKGKIRDVESFGMLCSEVELGIADKSEGILILPKDAPVGQPLAPFIGRDDIVFELNVTPNRGDALSHLGVARELASILGQKLKAPEAKLNEAGGSSADKIKVTLHNPSDAPDLCLQYHGRYIEGVKIKASPEWLQKRLLSIGLRPINNVVDVTNFVLMEYGQPLHAFDYAQVKGGQIHVRRAKKGEKLPLLDGTEVTLDEQDLVIADGERPVALAGVMGGGNSEVTDKTANILLEAAQFDAASVRKTSRRHQKKSDSSHRFERQVDARAVRAAMDRAAALIVETGGGKAYKGAVSQYSPLGKTLATGEARAIDM
ncbi:MAG: phenylalanine--tRNA ligase subunit beta, partial [Deltaproteobacteria bacterium]|nr:phenylalanine--tRNA ligase subunit beta [Deltaproteobacteria bacterium]